MIRLANVWVNRCATEIMGRGEEALVEHGTVFVHQRLKLGCRLSQGRHYVKEGFVFTRENNSTLLNSCVSESSMQPPVRFYIHSSTLTSKKADLCGACRIAIWDTGAGPLDATFNCTEQRELWVLYLCAPTKLVLLAKCYMHICNRGWIVGYDFYLKTTPCIGVNVLLV